MKAEDVTVIDLVGKTSLADAMIIASGRVNRHVASIAETLIEALKDATDPYVTARSAYTQHREAVVREATGKTQALPDFN